MANKTHKKIRPIRIEGDVAYVTLTQGKVAVIDAADVDIVDGRNWTAERGASGIWYAKNGMIKPHGMHNLITGKKGIDHHDRDGLNNRRNNLRDATSEQNARNRSRGSANKSGYKGVSFRADRGTWAAMIRVRDRLIKLGTYRDKVKAAMAYDAAAIEHFGIFACTNFPTIHTSKTGAGQTEGFGSTKKIGRSRGANSDRLNDPLNDL